MRYFFEISYKGTNYHGWQIQNNAISVQQIIQERLKQLLNLEIEITGSSRTDTGVHATQQFFHVDFSEQIDELKFKYRMNAVLPNDIVIRSIRKVGDDAHARFDAISRRYKYVINSQKDPFKINEAYIYNLSINLKKLNAASEILVGSQDFKSFSKVKTQVSNFNCEVYNAYCQFEGANLVFYIKANRFLRGMVRAIVGTLLMVNEEKISIKTVSDILQSRNRQNAGRSVPAEGLFLEEVEYSDSIFENLE